jgi:hypothetical protein
MSQAANVQTSDSIEAVKAALATFIVQVEEGLSEMEGEMRRVLDWLEHDRPRHWKERVRLSWDAVAKAKAELHRCLMFPIGVQERPSCHEERAALKRAEAYRAHCEEKTERLKHWIREIRHELYEYEGRITKLKETVAIDTPGAVAALNQILLRIENYAELRVETAAATKRMAAPETFARPLAEEVEAIQPAAANERTSS